MTTTAAPFTAPSLGDNVQGAHTTVVSIGVIVLVTIILVELAGTSHSAAVAIAFLFLGVLAIAGMTHMSSLQNLSQYPAQPK